MTEKIVLDPHPPEYDRFLQAPVGEDRSGYVVTVLSTLARLGLDPWKETAALAALGHDAARVRLGLLLSRFRDVPALGRDHGKVARDLSLLLPDSPAESPLQRAASTVTAGTPVSRGVIWALLALVLVLYQFLFTGTPGSGQ